MGFTRYIKQKKSVPQKKWNEFISAAKPVLDKYSEIICEECDKIDAPPIVNKNEIVFNGKGEAGHETFVLNRKKMSDFDFCKTARKPYDAAVKEILDLAKKDLSEYFNIDSDEE